MLNEADTRATLVEPKLKLAGWRDQPVRREFYYHRDHVYAPGKIILIGDQARRGKPKQVDYLLRLSDGFPIAVVEAEPEAAPPESGLEQAKGYAQDLGLAFAYATNGHRIIEYDFFTHTSRELDAFPTPDELWERWTTNTGLSEPIPGRLAESPVVYGTVQLNDPLRYPYCPASQCTALLLCRR